jgi:hypothetical protein
VTSALVGGEWSASGPWRFTSGEKIPSGFWPVGWVSPRADLNDMEERIFLTLPRLEPPCRPARRQSPFRLSIDLYGAKMNVIRVSL